MNDQSNTPRLLEWLREHAPDCGDNSCLFGGRGKGGMRTNGGCRCFRDVRPDMKRIFIERIWAALNTPVSETRPTWPGCEIAGCYAPTTAHSAIETTSEAPVGWANWKVGTKSLVAKKTREEAERSVRQSRISAPQEGEYELVPLYGEQALFALIDGKKLYVNARTDSRGDHD